MTSPRPTPPAEPEADHELTVTVRVYGAGTAQQAADALARSCPGFDLSAVCEAEILSVKPVVVAGGGGSAAGAFACPTTCDTDCEQACHESHAVAWKRDHDPEQCRAVIVAEARAQGAAAERAEAEADLADLRARLKATSDACNQARNELVAARTEGAAAERARIRQLAIAEGTRNVYAIASGALYDFADLLAGDAP